MGDIIDRGPDQIQTLELVRGMVEAGDAFCIMGNHEYNALQYQLGYRELKEFGDPHDAFLKEAPKGSHIYQEWLNWFRRLPLWHENQEFCAIHACWDVTAMSILQKHGLGENAIVDNYLLTQAGEWCLRQSGDSAVFNALETILKGAEIALPDGLVFKDKDGWPRNKIRTRWWMSEAITSRQIPFMPDLAGIPDSLLPPKMRPKCLELSKPVFIGHYWLAPDAAKAPLSPHIACLDYSAGKGGPLVAYRWNSGDTALSSSHFAWV